MAYRSSAGYNGDVLAPLMVFPTEFAVWNEEMEKLLSAMGLLGIAGNKEQEEQVLYVGCGRRIPFRSCWCVDLDPNMREGIEHFFHANMLVLPFSDNYFEYALSSHTLEHVSENKCRLALEEQARVVKPGGLVGAIVPDVRWTRGMDNTHVREYTQEEFVEIFVEVAPLKLLRHGVARSEYSFWAVWQKGGDHSELPL